MGAEEGSGEGAGEGSRENRRGKGKMFLQSE